MKNGLRDSGIGLIGKVDWGTHFCQFYENKDDLLQILVPYFIAGLKNNELCTWVTSEPLDEQEALTAMRAAMPGFDRYLDKGQIEITPYTKWYGKDGNFETEKVLRLWAERVREAELKGYEGLRVTGNTYWVDKESWRPFTEYENRIEEAILSQKMIAACTYPLHKCGAAAELADIVSNHQFTLIRRDGEWSVIRNANHALVKKTISDSEKRYRGLYESIRDGIVMADMDGGIRDCNQAYLEMLGYTREEISSMSYKDITPEKWHALEDRMIESVILSRGYSDEYEKEYIRKDGRVFPVRLRVWLIRDGNGDPSGMWAFVRDITESKEAERSLIREKDFSEALISSLPGIFYLFDGEGRILRWNRNLETFTGYSAEDIASMRPTDFFLEEEKRHISAKIREVFESGHASTEGNLVSRDGTKNPYLFRGVRLSMDGAPYLVGIGIDITERKEAEERLKAAHGELEARVAERTRELVEANESLKAEAAHRFQMSATLEDRTRKLDAFLKYTMTPLAFLDRGFNFIMVSNSYAEAAGRRPGFFYGKNHFELCPHKENESIFREVVREKEPYLAIAKPFENPDHLGQGITYWDWSLVPVLDSSGEVEFLVFALNDVTERKNAELALRKSEERFRVLVEAASDLVWEVDEKGVYTYVSPRVRDILGYEPAEVLGKKPFDLMIPGESERVLAEFIRVKEQRRPFALIESRYRHKDGRTVVLETSGTPVFGYDMNLIGYRGIDRDVTEKKAAEEENERIQAQLLQSQKMEAIGVLAGGIAHDFNNLMVIIKLNSNLAMKRAKDGGEIAPFLEQVMAASERGENLTKRLLIFSRRHPTELKSLNLNKKVSDLLNILSRTLAENIKINTGLAGGIRRIKADKCNIEQLIMNLVINARDAMPKGGTINIRTENIDLKNGTRRNGTPVDGSYVRLTVEDTGTGMEKEVIDRIFEPFYTTKGPGGTGLGLAVVQGIVKDLNGWIEIESSPGKGSRFMVYLPVYLQGAEEVEINEADTEEPLGAGERVLLVEDEKLLRRSVSVVLSKSGYKVFEASSAKEAIAIFEREKGRFNLVFSDMVLHDRDGIQLIDALMGKNPGFGVLITSGYLDVESQWPAIKDKGYNFLQKPYEIPDLLRSIKHALMK